MSKASVASTGASKPPAGKKQPKGRSGATRKAGRAASGSGRKKTISKRSSSDGTPSKRSPAEKAKSSLRFQPGTRFLCRVVRKSLGLTQKEMAEVLGVSKKTIESYEQRWRATPVNVERLALLYLGCFRLAEKGKKVECWKMTKCPKERREQCVVWQVKRGDLCWMFGGTMCEGTQGNDWRAKFETCTRCKVLRAVFE